MSEVLTFSPVTPNDVCVGKKKTNKKLISVPNLKCNPFICLLFNLFISIRWISKLIYKLFRILTLLMLFYHNVSICSTAFFKCHSFIFIFSRTTQLFYSHIRVNNIVRGEYFQTRWLTNISVRISKAITFFSLRMIF